MSIFSSLTKNQRDSFSLLKIGTFLECFDFMLYIHMAILVNEVFFPTQDVHTFALLSAFSFCFAFLVRPFALWFFNYLAKTIGRRSTVLITTMMTVLSCVTMMSLAPYAQLGIASSWIIFLCRFLQGMASTGDSVGAELYLTENFRPPLQYPMVAFVEVARALGSVTALCVAAFFTSFQFNWRMVFVCGAAMGLLGVMARMRLREAPEFLKRKETVEGYQDRRPRLVSRVIHSRDVEPRVVYKVAIMYFCLLCVWPGCFYCIYIYCGGILKTVFHYTPEAVIQHMLIVGLVQALALSTLSYLSYWVYPLKILQTKLVLFFLFLVMCPFWLDGLQNVRELLILQCVFVILAPHPSPASSVFLLHFPLFKRFTYSRWIWACSQTLMYILTAFGLIYLMPYFGYKALWFILGPSSVAFACALHYFARLEQKSRNPSPFPGYWLNKGV